MTIHGTITPGWLAEHGRSQDYAAEVAQMATDVWVYYYFDGDQLIQDGRPLVTHIMTSRAVGSVARGLSLQEIYASLGSDEPHYGDGTYVTFHGGLNDSHDEIKRNHGMGTSSRNYRAVLKVLDVQRFSRVMQTAGVGLASPQVPVATGTLIMLQEPNEMKIIRIEHLSNGRWTIWHL